MKIVVFGGNGLIGKKLVGSLAGRGHGVVAASRSTGIDVISGEGLAAVLADADVVVDVMNSPSFEAQAVLEFFETSGRNLAVAEKAAGVGHHVALSVVGTGRLDNGYLRAKVAQEWLIRASGIHYTIVQATQFFEFMGGIADVGTSGQTVRLPPVLMQPIFSDDVADAMADATLAAPIDGTVELAGPERIRMDEAVRRFLRATGDARTVIADETAGYFGAPVGETSLLPGDNPLIGPTRFDDWLGRSSIAA
jgi:uncharacterized protein YbjT (DUF2867 family)